MENVKMILKNLTSEDVIEIVSCLRYYACKRYLYEKESPPYILSEKIIKYSRKQGVLIVPFKMGW